MQNAGGRIWGLTGWVASVFYLAGCVEYLMMRLSYQPYLDLMTADQQAWLKGLPLLAGTLWAVSVWGGLLGGVLMVLRVEGGVISLAVAAAATVGLTAYTSLLVQPALSDIGGPEAVRLMIGIAIFAVLIWLVARLLKRWGW